MDAPLIEERAGLLRAIELILTAGVFVSGALLLAGLATGREPLLRAGVIMLVATPVARVFVLTLGLFQRRDWFFGVLSLAVLGVLLSGAWLALLVPRR